MKTANLLVFIIWNVLLFKCYFSTQNDSLNISKYIKEIDVISFNSTLENNNVFLEFYTQWCGHCRALDKVLVEVALNLHGKNITIAKLDAGDTSNQEIVNIFNVESFPSFFFISGSQYLQYTGSKTSEALTGYLTNELNTDLTKWTLQNSLNDLSSLLSTKKNIILFVGDANKYLNEFNVYRRITDSYDKKLNIFWTNQEDSYKLFNFNPNSYSVVYYIYLHYSNKFSEPIKVDLNPLIDTKSLLKMSFAPIFNKVSMKQLEKQISNYVSSLILVYNEQNQTDANSTNNNLIDSLIPIAEQYKGNLYFFKLEFDENDILPIFDNFQITSESQVPTCIIIDIHSSGELNKYKLEGDLNPDSFRDFLKNYTSQNLSKIITSEEIPAQKLNQHGVYKMVRKSFNETVMENDNDEFFILYCVEDNQNCQEVKQRFYNISERLNNSKNIKFAEYDSQLNENDIVEIVRIPEIIYFPSSSAYKINATVRFSGNYTTEQINAFIAQNANKENLVLSSTSSNEEGFPINETLIKQTKIDEDNEEQGKENENDENSAKTEEVDDQSEDGDESDEQEEDEVSNNETENKVTSNDTRIKDDL